MFMTKKKLEKIVRDRIEEKERERYLWDRIGEVEKELHQRMDRLSEAVRRLESVCRLEGEGKGEQQCRMS